MSAIAIQADALGKRYLIGHAGGPERYATLRDAISQGARRASRRITDLLAGRPIVSGQTTEAFWALRDVCFEIMAGEVVGIIGRNGAGKSTLLKVLSRITEPTSGRVEIEGRVASLLEVGTGFHPELSGRENIFLNGAILGMSQAQIRARFDEIVAFAEIAQFLDTPVKRYSTGMYVRLAFAIAAHVEPEILIVDEVLAVGDADFQRKCLGKMSDAAGSGRTVLFVSHNMAAVSALCRRGLLLSAGQVVFDGPAPEAIANYAQSAANALSVSYPSSGVSPQIEFVSLDEAALARGDLVVSIGFASPFALAAVGGVSIRSETGQAVWGSNSRFHPETGPRNSLVRGQLTCRADRLPLCAGAYTVSVWLASWHEDYDHKADVLRFVFRADERPALRPSPEIVGHLDWAAAWTSNELEPVAIEHSA